MSEQDEMENARLLARRHARMLLQEQALNTPKHFDIFEKAAYELELYKWADKVVGNDC